jgi:hypothetical protein
MINWRTHCADRVSALALDFRAARDGVVIDRIRSGLAAFAGQGVGLILRPTFQPLLPEDGDRRGVILGSALIGTGLPVRRVTRAGSTLSGSSGVPVLKRERCGDAGSSIEKLEEDRGRPWGHWLVWVKVRTYLERLLG